MPSSFPSTFPTKLFFGAFLVCCCCCCSSPLVTPKRKLDNLGSVESAYQWKLSLLGLKTQQKLHHNVSGRARRRQRQDQLFFLFLFLVFLEGGRQACCQIVEWPKEFAAKCCQIAATCIVYKMLVLKNISYIKCFCCCFSASVSKN